MKNWLICNSLCWKLLSCPSSLGTMKSSSIFERQTVIWSLVFVVWSEQEECLIKNMILIKTRHHGSNFLLRIQNWQAKILFGCIYLFPVLYWKNIDFFCILFCTVPQWALRLLIRHKTNIMWLCLREVRKLKATQ